ncbi:MAG TPA: hypothetical protein VJ891_04015 [Casimicrobiaceae bacterium]|nr:hypothetical protein [Casimicrobiaceae bacterium]
MNTAVLNALRFIESQGVVLASAKGPVPRLIEFIAGEGIFGNWWSHPHANQIYNVLAEVCESQQVLVCRLINRKVTLIHFRLWPALVNLADRIPTDQLARVREEHTATGRHTLREIPFPHWVPAEVAAQAKLISTAEAVALLGPWFQLFSAGRKPAHRS